jgi:hypothetical protein
MPTGSPIADAISTTMPVPTIAFAIPPPASPGADGIFVKKSQFTADPPRFTS